MIQSHIQLNLSNAKEYFREHLSVGDYYSEGVKIAGEWLGAGAEKLGLKGNVNEAAFVALCEGKNPATGQKLGQRINTVRQGVGMDEVANRRIFYDFAIAPPKSVSVVALYQDDRILHLHNWAVRKTMFELEKFAETRVRKGGQRSERLTGNLVAATFRHDTSRELDPHLHTHCVVFNATFDPTETRWKALEVQSMYRAQNFATNYYRHDLCKGLRVLGYEITNNARGFEIKGVPASIIARFSKRNQQITEEADQRLKIGSPVSNVSELRGRIAHGNRRRKLKDSTADRLRPAWGKQMTPDETKALGALRSVQPKTAKPADVAGISAWADEHLFERRSVVNDYELMSVALARGRGEDFDLAALREAIEKRAYIREDGTRKLTSREVLRRELGIVVAAHDGRGQHVPLSPGHQPAPALSAEQAEAVRQILASRDFITLFRGSAGTGKSFTLREVTQGLRAAGHPVVVLAPQRQQVADLCVDGLAAKTLAHCLETKTLPPRAVVLVDESGQIGGKQLGELVALVKTHGGRLILSGDTRQHGAVQASDALRAIEEFSGLKAAVLREIRRQDPARAKSAAKRAFVAAYRRAVEAAAAGRIEESFDGLDRLGCIREVASDDRRATLAREYLASVDRHERALVVAQTWNEINSMNEAIRAELQTSGRIVSGVALKTYQAVDLNEAEKQDARFYQPGQFAYVIKRYGRLAKGDLCPIAGTNERGLVLIKDGRRSTMSYRYTHRLAIAVERETRVAPGDRLQLKFNGKSKEGLPIANGELVTVRRVAADGSLTVEDDRLTVKTLSPQQRLFNRGYAVTSYASQGKTVDTVLVADAGCVDDKGMYWETLSAMFGHLGRERDLILLQVRPADASPDWKPAHVFNFLDDPHLPYSAKAKIICDVAASLGQRTDQSFFRLQAQVQMEFAFQVLAVSQLPVTLKNAYGLLTMNDVLTDVMGMLAERKTPEAELLADHYEGAFRAQPAEQLGGVKTTVANYLKYFTDPGIAEVFCPSKSSFNFDELDRGKVVCISLPQRYHVERRYINTLLKLSFYSHALRRFDKPLAARAQDNLLILWADEAQKIVTASDDGMSDYNVVDVIREARATVVAATQSYQSLMPPMGDERKAKVFIANMANRVTFCAADEESAKIAADTLGKRKAKRRTYGWSAGKRTISWTDEDRYWLEPHQLRKLRTFEAVVQHAAGGFRKVTLPPMGADGKIPPWYRNGR